MNGVAEYHNGQYTMCLLVNGAKTAKRVSELDAQRFTIPILKCLVDFRGVFYVVKMSFLCLQKKIEIAKKTFHFLLAFFQNLRFRSHDPAHSPP